MGGGEYRRGPHAEGGERHAEAVRDGRTLRWPLRRRPRTRLEVRLRPACPVASRVRALLRITSAVSSSRSGQCNPHTLINSVYPWGKR